MPTTHPAGEAELMDDSVRAAQNANFKVTKSQLIGVVEAYRRRKYVEDLDYIKTELNGTAGLLEALDSNATTGVSANSLAIREKVFGTHYKPPPQRTPFCTMLCAALDDFMLKILIGCAIFSIIVEMAFAETPEKRKTAWIEGFAILFAVAVVSVVSAWSDYKKEGQFLKQQMLEEHSKIVSLVRYLY